jgi:hypothetical protein
MSLAAGSLPAESLQLVADMVLIDRHMSRYTWLVDARRYAEWAALFTPDAIFEQAWQDAEGKLHPVNFGAGLRLQGRRDIARFVAARFGPEVPANLPRPAAGVGHRLVNRLIDVDGNTATLKARGPDGRFQYEVELRRTGEGPDGGWQFSRLCIIFNEDRRTPDINGVAVPT